MDDESCRLFRTVCTAVSPRLVATAAALCSLLCRNYEGVRRALSRRSGLLLSVEVSPLAHIFLLERDSLVADDPVQDI